MAKVDYADTIKKLMKAQRRPLSALKIAKKTDITWPTAKKYLEELEKAKAIRTIKVKDRIFWVLKSDDGKTRTVKGEKPYKVGEKIGNERVIMRGEMGDIEVISEGYPHGKKKNKRKKLS